MANQHAQGKRDKDRGSQGFQNMNPDRQKEIAPEGGRDAQEFSRTHQFTQEETQQGRQTRNRGQQGTGRDAAEADSQRRTEDMEAEEKEPPVGGSDAQGPLKRSNKR